MVEVGKLVGAAGISLIGLGVTLSFTGHLKGGLVVGGVGLLLMIAGVAMVSRKKARKPPFDHLDLRFNDGPVPDDGGLLEVDNSHSIEVGNVTGARKGHKILSAFDSYDIRIGEVRFREDHEPDEGEKES